MEVISRLLSFIPVLMIVLFIVRFVAGAGKRKKPARIDSIRNYRPHNREIPKPQAAEQPAAEPATKRTFGISEEPASASGAGPESKPMPAPAAEPEPQYKMDKPEKKPETSSRKRSSEAAGKAPHKNRLNSLPELKKAVVWAEILGKPKGLQ